MIQATKNDVAQLVSLIQVAAEQQQPITLNVTLDVFKGIMAYQAQAAVEAYQAGMERQRKENEQGDLLTPKETKAMLHGISDATLWRYVQQGIFHKKLIGGKPYYSRKEIQKIVEG